MATVKARIRELLKKQPGLTDAEIREELGLSRHQHANNEARNLAREGVAVRIREKGRIRNYLVAQESEAAQKDAIANVRRRITAYKTMTEDEVKQRLRMWLRRRGWEVALAMGKERGPDIVAEKGELRWLIETKGTGSRPQMNHNYFLTVLGQILQRMEDGAVRYSVAFPDQFVYRRLWGRLPKIAKERTLVTALFVGTQGEVDEVR